MTKMTNLSYTTQVSNYIKESGIMNLVDYGPRALTVDVVKAALNNNNYRSTLWTGKHLQLTLMTIRTGDDIGLELHPNTDQFLFVAEGSATALVGESKDTLAKYPMFCEHVLFVPAGTYHNVINTGNRPLRLISVYGPPNHAHGTVHRTKEAAMQDEHDHY